MKKLIRFSAAACLIILTLNNAEAQVRFGPKAGVNFSTMTLKSSGISIDPTNMTGFQAGVIAEISLGRNLALQPGFLYSAKGSNYYISGFDVDVTIKPNYLEVPINAIYKIGAGPLNVLLIAGPYVAYGIGGTYSMSSVQTTIDEAIKFGSGQDNDLKPFDVGVNMGAGVELSRFQLTFQYCLGLTNITPVTDNGGEQKNKVMTISLAYLFGAK
jgi:hypothetical protein